MLFTNVNGGHYFTERTIMKGTIPSHIYYTEWTIYVLFSSNTSVGHGSDNFKTFNLMTVVVNA